MGDKRLNKTPVRGLRQHSLLHVLNVEENKAASCHLLSFYVRVQIAVNGSRCATVFSLAVFSFQ